MSAVASEKQPPKRLYAPPWREVLPSGKLGDWYGPKTAATFARHVARFRDWSYKDPADKTLRVEAEAMRAFMRLPDGTLRIDVAVSETRVYRFLYEQGLSIRETARAMEVSRETVRSYLARLRSRMR